MSSKTDDLMRDVEIIEPPIQELKKRGPWFTTACLSGCGCVLIFIIALIMGIKLYIGTGPKEIKNLPSHFPAVVPIYDQYNIHKITVVSGQYKSRSLELTSFLPKVLLSPLIYTDKNESESSSKKDKGEVFKAVWQLLVAPTSDNRDMIKIEWRDISSEPQTMIQYYQTRLEKDNFKTESEIIGYDYKQILFVRDDKISVNLYVEFAESPQTTPYAFIMVNVPKKSSADDDE